MELRDIVVTPLMIILVYVVAYAVRQRVTDSVNRRYFIPALTVKILGAISVGIIYDYYYHGGDTFSYHKYGSRIIWEAFMDSPTDGFKLLLTDGSNTAGIYKYSSRILFFTDPSSYVIVRIAAILDLITFSTYSSTAVLFAVFSFAGMWLFFKAFYVRYPYLHRGLSIAAFFIPSVFFWGSGLLKDTITLGCLGMATYSISTIFIEKKPSLGRFLLLAGSLLGLYFIKIYILLTFLPAAIIWIFTAQLPLMRSTIVKIMVFPFVIVLALAISYYSVIAASEGNEKYAVNKLAKTAQITAYDIRYFTGRDAGSGYSLGELDGTFGSLMALAPQAINVSLFRPYLWEVSNAFMLLSALESLALFMFFLYILISQNVSIRKSFTQPDIFFCLIFSISFAFAVGVSTFNFGTLARYKIPLLPFFSIALLLMGGYSKRDRKLEELEATE
ncbi:MAG TPA: hypothetical protein VK666_23230 [Chryseolinea sp.]|nr:hypothetical protein [Chryseolinea sp.]